MTTNNRCVRYDEEFKRTIVNIYQTTNKTQAALCQEYGVSPMTLNKWIKKYSAHDIEDNDMLTKKQIEKLQKRISILEKENIILKKTIIILTKNLDIY